MLNCTNSNPLPYIMNKLFTLILATTGTMTALGQSIYLPPSTVVEKPIDATVHAMGGGANDTLGLEDFLLATPSIYALPGGGYGSGTLFSVDTFNVPPLGELEATTTYHSFAEGHFVDDPHYVLGAMFFLGALDNASGDSTTEVTVNVHLIEDNMAISDPATVQNPDIAGPGQIMDATTLTFSELVDTANGGFAPNFVDFANTPWVNQDIAIALNISDVYTVTPLDTVALLTTADGEGDGEYTFHQVNQQIAGLGGGTVWSPTSAVIATQGGSGLDINFALFPIVTEAVGVEEPGFFDGIRASIYPNPLRVGEPATISIELARTANDVVVSIYSIDGKRMMKQDIGALGTSVKLPIESQLPAGSYVYAVQADGHRVAKRFVVTE